MGESTEYRVRWQREGKPKRLKIYQTKKGAEEWVNILNGDVAHSGEAEVDYYAAMSPLVGEPVIESRICGDWHL